MNLLAHISALVAAVAYLSASFLYAQAIFARQLKEAVSSLVLPRKVLFVGLLNHFLFTILTESILSSTGRAVARLPFMLSLVSILLVALFLLLEKRKRISTLGTFVSPLGLIFLIFGAVLFHAGATHETSTPGGVLLYLHLVTIVLAYVLFIFAFCVSAALLCQDALLKRKKINLFQAKLPSLIFLDRFNRWLLSLGFSFLLMGVCLGGFYAYALGLDAIAFSSRVLWSVPTVMVYAVVLLLVFGWGFRGRRVAWMTVLGFVSVLFSFFGAGISAETFHVH